MEHELQIANDKFNKYESVIADIEQNMLDIQKAWYSHHDQSGIGTPNCDKSIQVTVETEISSVQTDPYTCCLDQQTENMPEKEASEDIKEIIEINKTTKRTFQETGNNTEESAILNEDQVQELTLERSTMFAKYELQITEYQAKMDTLNKALEEKDLCLAQKQNMLDELMTQPRIASVDCTDKLALKSTINSLQKLINQKEETIMRYQNLLKEDRDEHSRAASRFQEEIKSLHDRILAMHSEARKTEEPIAIVKEIFETTSITMPSETRTIKNSVAQEEEIARLHEKALTFEAELNISKELSERWRQLAEERLKHIDHMRDRLV